MVQAEPTLGEVRFYTIFAIPLDDRVIVHCMPVAKSVELVDGKEYGNIGVFHASPVRGEGKSYTSKRFGIAFTYPSNFSLFESAANMSDGSSFDGAVTISPEPATSRALDPSFLGEGPANMAFIFYRNTKHLPLERWIKETNTAYTNYNPEVEPAIKLSTTKIAGMSAFTYHSDMGLYVTDYYAFLYKDWAVLFVVGDMGSETNSYKDRVLSSLTLKL